MLLLFLVSAGIFALEYFLKNHFEQNYAVGEERPVCKGRLRLTRYHNEGAFLNLGEKHPVFLRLLSVILCLGAVFMLIKSSGEKGNTGLKAGLSLLVGGAASNTWDRISRHYVVDYFRFSTGIRAVDRVVFNLADWAIMIGAILAVCKA